MQVILVLRSVKNFAKSFEFGKDGLCRGCPHEGLGMLVMVVHVSIDLALELGH